MEIKIPYGKAYESINIPYGMDIEVLESSAHIKRSNKSEDELVIQSMSAPIESPTLTELARGKNTATIICSDHTRPVPSKHILPHMLRELREGNPSIDITLLIATGCHRAATNEELLFKLGDKILREEKIIIHDCDDTDNLCTLGELPSGAPLVVNRVAVETDLLVAEGFIEPHFFAGFSGGRKSVLPGICGRETVLGNHCADFINNPNARAGVLKDNPIQRDMVKAASMLKLAYIVNVIIDSDKKILTAVSGDPIKAHESGCQTLYDMCCVKPSRLGDIVISSNGGSPLDQNIYQAVKGMTAAEASAAAGGVIILCAACSDGVGGEGFYDMLFNCESPAQLFEQISKVKQPDTQPDQWQAQILARVLMRHEVILVCEAEARMFASKMKMKTAASLEDAFDIALKIKGNDSKVTVIPDGVSVIVDQ